MKKVFTWLCKYVYSYFEEYPKFFAGVGILRAYFLATRFFVYLSPLRGYYYIFFPIQPVDPYYVNTSIIIGVLCMLVGIVFLVKIIKTHTSQNKAKYALIAFLVGIFSHGLFLLVNPKFVYEYHPNLLMYKSLDGKYIVNKDIYFYFVKKYGVNGDMPRFKTLKENIEALEMAKEIKSPTLYYSIFLGLKKIGYDKVLETYKDKTFQLYFMRYLLSRGIGTLDDEGFLEKNYKYLFVIKNNTSDDDVRTIINDFMNQSNIIIDKKTDNGKKIQRELLERTWKIGGINEAVFYSF